MKNEWDNLLPEYEMDILNYDEELEFIEFDQIEEFYESYQEYMVVKHQYLSTYMQEKTKQVS